MRKRWIAAIVFLTGSVLVFVSYNFWDIEVAYWFRGMNNFLIDMAQIVTVAGKSTWYFILLVPAFIGSHFILKNKLWSMRALFVILAISVSGLINLLIKWGSGRHRPINLFEKNLFGFGYFEVGYEMNSFPSGHALTVFALATAVSILFPRWRIPAFAAALVIALSRVIITSHYLSDVIGGAAVAVLCTLAVKHFFERQNIELAYKGKVE